ncbi:MAG: alpha/beta hydrolase [Telmatospirillum sp.]|nr:alpha/beta hydrolase [Telmatospirillum sp.]
MPKETLKISRRTLLAAGAVLGAAQTVSADAATASGPASWADQQVRYKTVTLDGIEIFYREAGAADRPVLLLLHGFPSSSHMFRTLIPQLSAAYRVIAPDYPGFGQSSQPAIGAFPYNFAAMADLVDRFTQAVGAKSYAIYMQDYGGPVGFRLALKHPERVRAFIVQNAVASVESWNPDVVKDIAPFWQARNAASEAPVRALLAAATTKFQYTHGAARSDRLSPDAWIHDQAGLDRPGNDAVQLEMLYNYRDNVAQYPAWRDYLAKNQPPMLIVWGKNDPFFREAGIDYFKGLLPKAEIHRFDAGHFALETHASEIAGRMRAFLGKLAAS